MPYNKHRINWGQSVCKGGCWPRSCVQPSLRLVFTQDLDQDSPMQTSYYSVEELSKVGITKINTSDDNHYHRPYHQHKQHWRTITPLPSRRWAYIIIVIYFAFLYRDMNFILTSTFRFLFWKQESEGVLAWEWFGGIMETTLCRDREKKRWGILSMKAKYWQRKNMKVNIRI